MALNLDRNGYGIGEVSRLTGINIETIRYYERIRIIPGPDRTEGGNRQYDIDGLKRLSFVKKSRDLGFSLAEIRTLLAMADTNSFTCGEVHQMTLAHLANVKQKLKDLRRLEKDLKSMAAECNRGDVPECPVINTLFEIR